MKKTFRMLILILVLLALSGCNFPTPGGEQTLAPEENILPAVSVGPLAPDVVETVPAPGSRIPVAGQISIYFNQPMDRASVESAVTASPALNGSFTWQDDFHLVFQPAQPWQPNASQEITVGTGAKSKDGLAIPEPVTVSYQTANYLKLVQALPEDQTREIAPDSPIVASFNQPVVPLGASSADLPDGFTLSPAAEGRGEWLNTSTYIFYPNPALTGGQEYTVSLNPALASVNGTALEAASSWKFITLPPGYVSYSPGMNELHIRLDAPVVVTFNQAMDPSSVEAGFRLFDQNNQPVAGKFMWSEDLTGMTFNPNALLKRGERYTYTIPAGVLSAGGTPINEELSRSFFAAMELFVLETSPQNGGSKEYYASVEIKFNAPLDIQNPENYVSVSPNVKPRITADQNIIRLYGNFEAEESYTVTVNGGVKDIWGDTLGDEYTFSFTGAPLQSSFRPATYQGGGILFVNPDQPLISAQVVNVDQVSVQAGAVSFEEFREIEHFASYEVRQQYQPANQISNTQSLQIERNRNQIVGLELNNGRGLRPGIYWVSMNSVPAIEYYPASTTWVVVSHVQLVLKVSATNALVWAVDTRTGAPVNGQPVRIMDQYGAMLASGTTDGTGLFSTDLAPRETYEGRIYAELASPGEDLYSLGVSTWSQGISGWDFGFYNQLIPPLNSYYIYTDRPIYRPGQEVSFKVIVREEYNGRYRLPDLNEVSILVRDGVGAELDTLVLPLSEFGTASGSYTLPEGALPGFYELAPVEEYYIQGVTFQVAEYRKPEIDLDLAFSRENVLAGDQLDAEITSRYFFDAPAAGSEIGWNLYAQDSYFSLPGYHVGPSDGFRSSYWYHGESLLGEHLIGGNGVTGDDGRFAISTPSRPSDRTRIYTLETVIQDQSGMIVANRTTTTIHPEKIYIGLNADNWVGQAGTAMGFDIRVVDWEKRSAGVQNLTAAFGTVTWELGSADRSGFPTYEKVVKVVSQGDFQSSDSGMARLSFTPADPGVYQLSVTSGNAVTELLIWVGGPGTGVWPDLDDKQLELLADAESYQPGAVATVFVPNPFQGESLALITYERGEIMNSQILKLTESGMSVPVPLTDDSAPNTFFTATLIGTDANGKLGYRYGVLNLPVSPQAFLLNVEVLGQPERTAPGDPVSLEIRVTDMDGNPVQGEFSLAVVDEAVLALAERFEEPIEEAFYGEQHLGVLTGISLVADAELFFDIPGGLGGGGGDLSVPSIRSDFEDTAYWNAVVTTGADGKASVEITLPDNLTTWQLMARGLSQDSRVGEGISQVVTTKPLLVRPVTPRFVIAGDQLELAAVVHNNTNQEFEARVGLSVSGFELDDPASAQQTVVLPAGGNLRVNWPGTVTRGDAVKAVFSAEGGGYQDASTPTVGDIPIMGYLAPQTFTTAGVLEEGGERLELVSLPRSFDPQGGELRLEMASSLAGVALQGLEMIEQYENASVEYGISSFLPNLEMLMAIREFGLNDPGLEADLDASLHATLTRIQNQQNFDGGWSWYQGGSTESDPTLTAYVLLGLVRAEQAGYPVYSYVLEQTREFLTGHLYRSVPAADWTWEYERDVFIHFALMQAGFPLFEIAESLAEGMEYMSPWSQALFGLLMANGKQQEVADSIFSNLQTAAIRSASGAHWSDQPGYWMTLSSDVVNNAIVIYALAQRDPASPLVNDAVRYMISHRDAIGGWGSSYGTAWSLMALTEVMRGTGELGGDFSFSATLNENPFATGEAGGAQQFNQVVAETSLLSLLPDLPNALKINRDAGQGRLYYRAKLNVFQPVADIASMNRGIGVSRAYYLAGQDCAEEACPPVDSAHVGDLLLVRVTLNLDEPLHYLQVDDFIPAGTEVLNRSLQTSQLGMSQENVTYEADDARYRGWGWWFFGSSTVYDDHVTWISDYLPAGTYEVTYTLVVLQPGLFQAIPAQARQIYFPEVQGISAGSVLEILP